MTSFALPLRSAPGVFFIFLFYFNYLVPIWALPPGVYAIINNVFSHEDEALVITFNGINEPVTVTVWTDDPAQHWVIAGDDTMAQCVSPEGAQDLQPAWGDHFVTVLLGVNYVWTIKNRGTGYTIQDGGQTVFWGVEDAVAGAGVTIGAGTSSETQKWSFESI
ncbi:hypothetical protein K503DRAFT_870302 [Rhizopogon vinicolor AM-OR11-026]|uniref:CCL2-like lectin domain-containing protein n=1 Tax=Rhizopogon vinicolor AM-OR11-026 TaxID=1314800 RepID=A0A1B7MHT3_9AGAM|nr:hypothetical protein K503DRAFT_870302 [Rhizopogon vinicolor AM-OR11-026]